MNGAAKPHSLSVISDGYRKPTRLCSRRAISVHAIDQPILVAETGQSQHTGIAQQLSDRALNAGNTDAVLGIVEEVYSDPATIALAKSDISSSDIVRFGSRILTMAGHVGKGWFAIHLGRMISPDSKIPVYILEAIFSARVNLSRAMWASVLSYRLDYLKEGGLHWDCEIAQMRQCVELYRSGQIEFNQLRAAMRAHFPEDGINEILSDF